MNPTAASLRILLVDQDPGLGHSLTGLLTAAGHRVDCQVAPPTLDRLRNPAPDLLVMEIPDSTSPALDLLRRLDLLRKGPRPAVIVTASDPALEFELLDVFDVLPKPLNEERLLEDVALLAARRGEPPNYPRLGEVDLGLFREYLASRSGLHFDRRNALLLEHGLRRRMRAIRSSSYRDYLGYLERHGEDRQELKKLLGLLTVGETYFFRYQAHFQALRETVLPELIGRNRERRVLRIWSAGCSTGEEPYSIAMLLKDKFPQLDDWQVDILATDVNKRALSAARLGSYGPRSLRATPEPFRKKYFRALADTGGLQLDPDIRRRVTFAYLNLQPGPYPTLGEEPFDLIFCRNVMIYFHPETTRRIVARIAGMLRPGGYLFLGHAETLQQVSREFCRLQLGGGFYYRRLASEPEPANPESGRPQVLPWPARREHLPAAPTAPSGVSRAASPAEPSIDPADLVELYAAAVTALEQENYDLASRNYAILLRHQPENVGALVGLGFLLANRGEAGQALEMCQRAQAVDDLYPESYLLLGLIRELEGRPRAAVSEYRRALLLDMSLIMPHYHLSRLFQFLDRPRDAARELRNTLRLLERMAPACAIPFSGGVLCGTLTDHCHRLLAKLAEV